MRTAELGCWVIWFIMLVVFPFWPVCGTSVALEVSLFKRVLWLKCVPVLDLLLRLSHKLLKCKLLASYTYKLSVMPGF